MGAISIEGGTEQGGGGGGGGGGRQHGSNGREKLVGACGNIALRGG